MNGPLKSCIRLPENHVIVGIRGRVMTQVERPITGKRAAQFLEVSEWTVWNWTKTLGLPFHKIGGKRRYFESELSAWVKSGDPGRETTATGGKS